MTSKDIIFEPAYTPNKNWAKELDHRHGDSTLSSFATPKNDNRIITLCRPFNVLPKNSYSSPVTLPMLSINSYMPYQSLYYEPPSWRMHDKFNLTKKNLTIWISKSLVDRNYQEFPHHGHPLDNKNLEKILEKSKVIEDQGRYLKYLINNY